MEQAQSDEASSVKVAVRIRPINFKEQGDRGSICTKVTPNIPQIWMGDRNAFTFDHVFDVESTQPELFEIITNLIDGTLEGKNATILAYGQTGSGKTFTMGTAFSSEEASLEISKDSGIIHRSVQYLFDKISYAREAATERNETPPTFQIKAQFVELYNDEIKDLIAEPKIPSKVFPTANILPPHTAHNFERKNECSIMDMEIESGSSNSMKKFGAIPSRCSSACDAKNVYYSQSSIPIPSPISSSGPRSMIKIHENGDGGIYMVGVTLKPVHSVVDTLRTLRLGTLSRQTATTNMNTMSSRSHAIFTLYIEQSKLVPLDDGKSEIVTYKSKFHFVDLAGSERLKRTGAVGERAKEGISINSGLLALSNVISALGDKSRKASHVPYRDSKLTRLLSDSLGGNSETLMIACISPCDLDFLETMNTLRYANRARNIKNQVTVNQDKSSRTISLLRKQITDLETELEAYKQGKRGEGDESESDLMSENRMLLAELETLRSRLKALTETVDKLTATNAQLMADKVLHSYNNATNTGSSGEFNLPDIIGKYALDIESLRSRLMEAESLCEHLKKRDKMTTQLLNTSLSPRRMVPIAVRPGTAPLEYETGSTESVNSLLNAARVEVMREKKQVSRLRQERRKTKKSRRHADSVPPPHHENSPLGSNGINKREGVESGFNEAESDASTHSLSDSEQDYESDEEGEEEEGERGGGEDRTPEEIAQINDEINTKQRLIEQLELSNRRAFETKESYEKQISCLSERIKQTEEERDGVMAKMNPKAVAQSPQNVAKVREEYESKISTLKKELSAMSECLRKNNMLIKKNSAAEKQLSKLKSEVEEMKRAKVRLVHKHRDDLSRMREAEARRLKEIAQLKKETTRKDLKIRDLVTVGRNQEIKLKRKHEELNLLKKQKTGLSRKAAGKVAVHKRTSPVKAKKRWVEVQTNIQKALKTKNLVDGWEKDMLKLIGRRTAAKEEIENLYRQKSEAVIAKNVIEINLVNDEIDSLTSELKYIEENISDIQESILEVTANGTGGEREIEIGSDIAMAFEALSQEECEYIMRKMYEQTVSTMSEAVGTASKLSVLEQEKEQLTREKAVLNDLLSHVVSKYGVSDIDLPSDMSFKVQPPTPLPIKIKEEKDDGLTALSSTASNGPNSLNGPKSPNEILTPSTGRRVLGRGFTHVIDDSRVTSRKARKMTSTTQELLGALSGSLGGGGGTNNNETFVVPRLPGTSDRPNDVPGVSRSQSLRVASSRRDTYIINDGPSLSSLLTTDSQNNVTSSSNGSSSNDKSNAASSSSSLIPKRTLRGGLGSKLPSPALSSSTSTTKRQESGQEESSERVGNSGFSALPKDNDNFDHDTTFLVNTDSPPGSPNGGRKAVNVFHRLTSTTSGSNIEPSHQLGSIRPIREKSSQKTPFHNTHIAEGHTKAVLCIAVTDDLLFSGSKDTTAKIWDLATGKETYTLTGHPNSVSCIKFYKEQNILLTASHCYIKLFDIRGNKIIKTLTSSGGSIHGELSFDPTKRLHELPAGEVSITSMALSSPSSSTLFTSYGERVRVWDLRSLDSLGLTPAKHSSTVMALETHEMGGKRLLLTGSKDHYIKVYEYTSLEPSVNVTVQPKVTLAPPHYDGIESFAVSGSTLFSGSRDNCIKKWDLSKSELAISYTNAHAPGSWITGLAFAPSSPSYLISGSRDGALKLWHTDSPRSIGSVEVHKGANVGINSIATNSSTIFTGSNNDDGAIAFWKLRKIPDVTDSPSSDSSL